MNLDEYSAYDGLGLAELVRRRDVTAHELADLALAGIARVNPALNAVIETFPDRAERLKTTAPDGGPFQGVPFLIKDLPIEAGTLAEMGSTLAQGLRADHDTELMKRFRRAGLVSLGRTTTSEFALAAATECVLTGQTRNPWDATRSAAGSSGGSAAITAAGAVPLASGSDAGGSIRMPASFCGLVGLKPTRGRITDEPDDGNPYSGLNAVFALTRTVRDCAALLDAVAGPGTGDPFQIPPPVEPYLLEVGRSPDRLRIAFTTAAWSGWPVDAELASAVSAIAGLFAEMGHVVEEAAPEFDYEPYIEAQKVLWCVHSARDIRATAAALGRTPSEENLQTTTWTVYRQGVTTSADAFLAALSVYSAITRQVAAFFRNYDVLITPTCTITPRPLGTYDPNAAGAGVGTLFDQLAPHETFTALFNATGQPAMSLPLHESDRGLPIGVQIVARFGEEATLFRLAGALEEARPWRHRRPSVHVAN